jgi:uncharacterized RmlC-like cupin family protein
MAEQEPQWYRLYFDEWVARDGLDLIKGAKVDDVFTMPLKPWARTGGNAVQIQLDGTGDLNAAYVQEIPPGKHLAPMRHVYEEMVYVLGGRGATTVWYKDEAKHTFEWGAGSLFAIPLNSRYQHFNTSGQEPARYFAVTTAPIVLNLFRDDDFIFHNDAVFPHRFRGEPDYFSGEIRWEQFGAWGMPLSMALSNFYPDIYQVPLRDAPRGLHTRAMIYEVGNGVLGVHAVEYQGGTFTKVHRHGPGAHILWLSGEGYTLMWPDGGEMVREDWSRGSIVVPPNWWWHQHCMVSREPARHVALKVDSKRNAINQLDLGTLKSTKSGGSQIDYEDLPADLLERIQAIFAEECQKRGTPMHMEAVFG